MSITVQEFQRLKKDVESTNSRVAQLQGQRQEKQAQLEVILKNSGCATVEELMKKADEAIRKRDEVVKEAQEFLQNTGKILQDLDTTMSR